MTDDGAKKLAPSKDTRYIERGGGSGKSRSGDGVEIRQPRPSKGERILPSKAPSKTPPKPK